MKKYDIVLVTFPFSDLSNTKLRPAVIIASPGGQNQVLCQITTKQRSINTYEVPLLKKHTSGDIRFDSNIYVDMIFTLHQDLITKKIGAITNTKTRQLLQEKIQALFA
ncbi:MAG: type II toxin-antitoxin system PemK/MazF family toxin [Candidatus Woesearchaeota archaeon]